MADFWRYQPSCILQARTGDLFNSKQRKNIFVRQRFSENTVNIDITDDKGTIQNVEYQRKYFYGVEDPHQSLTSMEYIILSPPKRYIFRGFTDNNARVLEIYKGNEKPKIKRGEK